eukprot:SAG31_NODE_125_length_23649_cov_7.156202_15_plen_150_part_00
MRDRSIGPLRPSGSLTNAVLRCAVESSSGGGGGGGGGCWCGGGSRPSSRRRASAVASCPSAAAAAAAAAALGIAAVNGRSGRSLLCCCSCETCHSVITDIFYHASTNCEFYRRWKHGWKGTGLSGVPVQLSTIARSELLNLVSDILLTI